jgi:methylenetetrahydrofolate--tRNA-(uracil-5-)-methyltransferase
MATGLLAGINAARMARGCDPSPPPRATACGCLVHYIANANTKDFQPVNMTFGLLSETAVELRNRVRDKKERHRIQVLEALAQMDRWIESMKSDAAAMRIDVESRFSGYNPDRVDSDADSGGRIL